MNNEIIGYKNNINLIKDLKKLDDFNFQFYITKEFEDLIRNSFLDHNFQFYLNNQNIIPML